MNALVHVCDMKHLSLVILMALAPLSWGEEYVYYCVEEHKVALEPTDSGDAYEVTRYKAEKFTFKYEADANRLAFKGRLANSDLDCEACYPEIDEFGAKDDGNLFLLRNGRVIHTLGSYSVAVMNTGTCTKF